MTAAANDLITIARAKQSNRQITDGTYDTQLQVWVTSVSEWIIRYCKRDFYSRTYDELYNGSGDGRLLLREYPVQSINHVFYGEQVVLQVKNTLTSTNQRARVSVASTGLNLTRIASGAAATVDTTVLFATYTTIQACAAAIIALGAGWTAQSVGSATGDFGLFPSRSLYVAQSRGDGLASMGPYNCRGEWAGLTMHIKELMGYTWDARGWLLRTIPYTDPELSDPGTLTWPAGVNNFRIGYVAGYTQIPEGIQEAAAIWVAHLWSLANRDPAAQNEVASTTGSGYVIGEPPKHVRSMLAPYKRNSVMSNQS
jgi:hypothetical protein